MKSHRFDKPISARPRPTLSAQVATPEKPASEKAVLTRADIAAAVHCETGLPKPIAAGLVDDVLTEIASALISGQDVKLAKFGAFKLIDKKERQGRNPRTGTLAVVSPRRVVTFKASPALLSRVNRRRGGSAS